MALPAFDDGDLLGRQAVQLIHQRVDRLAGGVGEQEFARRWNMAG